MLWTTNSDCLDCLCVQNIFFILSPLQFYLSLSLPVNRHYHISGYVRDAGDGVLVPCGSPVAGPVTGEWTDIHCPPRTEGRFARLQKVGTPGMEYLELCEVKVIVTL